MPVRTRRTRALRRLAVLALALASLSTLGGCFSIPARAWQNGAEWDGSGPYRALANGDRSIRTQRRLYQGATPFHWERPAPPFTPFTPW